MKGIIKSVPIRFIQFPSGNEYEENDIIRELYDMEDKDWTSFNLSVAKDKDLYDWIKSIQTCEIRDEHVFSTCNSVRIYWNENSDMIDKMVTEIFKLFPDS